MLFSERLPIYASRMTISDARIEQHAIIAGFLPHHWLYKIFSGGTTEHHVIIGFGELTAVD